MIGLESTDQIVDDLSKLNWILSLGLGKKMLIEIEPNFVAITNS